jgi:hypothetical protein
MVDTRTIDMRAFYEQYVTLAGKPSRVWRTGEREFHSNCPWCGGQNRFAFWSSGRYSCSLRASGCGRYSRDVIDFLRAYEGLSFAQACDLLGIEAVNALQRRADDPPAAVDEPPSRQWQERAAAVIHHAQRLLWSSRGQSALDFLRQRGLTDDTIRSAHLGYIPRTREGSWFKDDGRYWGRGHEEGYEASVWLPEGVLIPWSAGGQIWKLHVRRLRGLEDGDAKYVQITGSHEGCYHIDAICVDAPLVLCEGEFDAIAGEQACGDLAAFVATGATTRARRDRWLARMGLASCVLVAYDDDAPNRNGKRAGDAGSAYWMRILPHAIRWMPWAHDLNEMLTLRQDIRAWVTLGVAVAASNETPVQVDCRMDECVSDEMRSGVQVADTLHGGDHAILTSTETGRNAMDRPSTEYSADSDCTVFPARTSVASSPRQLSSSVHESLSPSPRTCCLFELVSVGSDQRIRATRCPGKALANGWCAAHQHAQEVLNLGAHLGYPRLEVTPHRAIGEGKGSWIAYAKRATPRWLSHDLPFLKLLMTQGGTL